MAIDFPDSPVVDQTFGITDGPSWVWNGTTWDLIHQTSDNGADVAVYTPPTSGAPSTTIAAHLDRTIFIDEAGAFGDGATDDVTKIQAAIDEVFSAGGGTVMFGPKAYAISSGLDMKAGVRLQGVGPGGTISSAYIDLAAFQSEPRTRIVATGAWASSEPMLKVQTAALSAYAMAGCAVADMWLDGNDIPPYIIRVLSAQNCTFKNLIVSRATSVNVEEDMLIPDFVGETSPSTGGASTIVLAATSSNRDDLYNGLSIEITAGTSAGDTRTISDYVASTQTATVSVPWTSTPDNTSVYTITGTGVTAGQNANIHNTWDNIISWCSDSPATTLGWRQVGNPLNDTNRCTYNNIYVIHGLGIGFLIANADSNVYTNMNFFSKDTGLGIVLRGSDVNTTEFARALTFIQPQPSDGLGSGTGGFSIEAGTSASPRRIVIIGHSAENGTPEPIIESGCSVVLMEDAVSGYVSPGWKYLQDWAGEGEIHTGDTVHTAFPNQGTVAIPADVMGLKGALRIRFGVRTNNDASAKTFRIRWGTSVASSDTLYSIDMASNVYLEGTVLLQNRNDKAKQFLTDDTSGLTTTAPTELTRNTALAWSVFATCELADASDAMELEWFTVEVKRQTV